MSMRVRGIADGMQSLKSPLKQAIPFTTDIVYHLEALMYRLEEDHLKVICGHILFCAYSCARFGDTVYLDSLVLSATTNFWLVEAMSKRYKMGNAEKKRQFLPLVALGKGLYAKPWAAPWMEVRKAMDLENASITMPAWSESFQKWIDRPMSTGEAITFLREFIGLSGMSVVASQYTCHSWMAKSNQMDFDSRRLLGHHMAADASSTLTYSRDEMVRLQAQVHSVLQLIKNAEFDPDLSRIDRLRQLIGVDDFAEDLIPEGEDEQYDQSDLDESDIEPSEVEEVQRCEEIDDDDMDFEIQPGFVMHATSSIVHVIAADGRLMCGRSVGSAHLTVPKSVVLSSMPFCSQCERAKLDRLTGPSATLSSHNEEGESERAEEDVECQASDFPDWARHELGPLDTPLDSMS